MKQQVLTFYTKVLGRIRQPLLPHINVHRPVQVSARHSCIRFCVLFLFFFSSCGLYCVRLRVRPVAYAAALSLQKLIRLCGEVLAAPTENEEIQFLCIVCAKLKQDPYLVNFFLEVSRWEGGGEEGDMRRCTGQVI